MAAHWLWSNQLVLRRTKSLILDADSYFITEYSDADNGFYKCPIDTILLITMNEDCSLWSDSVGFARKRILVDLKSYGFNIDNELIKNTPAYMSPICSEHDDNFYKNQCLDLMNDTKETPVKEPTRIQKNEIQFINFLDKNSTQYNAKITLISRIHQDMNYLGRYSGETIHWHRIKMLLDEYGADYGFTATDTHAKAIAQILPSRARSQVEASKIVKNILLSE